jgi:uncharacterized repeat protein (TIGR02543 family)
MKIGSTRKLAQIVLLVVLLALVVGLVPTHASAPPGAKTRGSQATLGWLGWQSLGKPAGVTSLSFPVVGQNQDGYLEVFASDPSTGGTDYAVYHIKQTSGGWGAWQRLGAPSGGLTAPSVAQNEDGRLEVFAQQLTIWFGGPYAGPHYEAAHIHQTSANGPWSAWSSLDMPSNGGPVDLWEPYAGRNQDGRLAIFAKGQGGDGNIWTKSQTGAGVNTWSAWSSLGKPSGVELSPVLGVGPQQDGRLTIFSHGSNYEVYQLWQTVPNGGWSAWTSFGQPSGVNLHEPAVGRNEDGRLEFFTSGSDGQIWHKNQVAPNSYWSGWLNLGKPSGIDLGNPAVSPIGGALMTVFARGDDSAIWSIGQTEANGGFGDWISVGKPPGVNLTDQIAVGHTVLGFLMVFAIGDDGALWVNTQGWIFILCFDLILGVEPTAGGSVIRDPGPNCPSDGNYLMGTRVELKGVGASGYQFDRWTGDHPSTQNPMAVTMDGNKNITAHFVTVPEKVRTFLPLIRR